MAADFPTLAEIAETHRKAGVYMPRTKTMCSCRQWYDGTQGEHVQEVWVKSRTIETREQLDALPDRAVVLADNREVWSKNSGYYPDQPWWAAGSEIESPSTDIALPARLLWHPERDQ